MHHRPLALVTVLAAGDYLLWNWSLQGSHDVLALVSGLTLPPLAIALIWLLAVSATRLLARAARTPRQQSQGGPVPQQQQQLIQDQQQTEGERQQQASPSSKLAA